MSPEFSVSVYPDYCLVRLCRPQRRNSLSQNLILALIDLITQNPGYPLILSAEAPAFCAGFDFDWIANASANPNDFSNAIQLLYSLYRALLNHKAPTLAIVEGPAIGGGAGLAFCFDSLLVSPNARFALPQNQLKPLADIVLPIAIRKIPQWTGQNLSADQALFQHIADGPIASFPLISYLKTQKNRPPLNEPLVDHYTQIALQNRQAIHVFLNQPKK